MPDLHFSGFEQVKILKRRTAAAPQVVRWPAVYTGTNYLEYSDLTHGAILQSGCGRSITTAAAGCSAAAA